jgi:hypothetical protein
MPVKFGVHLAKKGWAVYEIATRRLVEIDGVPQIKLSFSMAEKAARLLNSNDYSGPTSLSALEANQRPVSEGLRRAS